MTQQNCYLITGANSGLGLEATKQLVQQTDAHIYMLCRSEERANTAMEDIVKNNANAKGQLSFLKFDGDDDATTMQQEIVDKLPQDAVVKGIILNAGGFGDGGVKKKSPDEFAPAFTACDIAKSNLIGHANLVHILQKAGKISKETRIVASGSEGSFAMPMKFDQENAIEDVLTGTTKAPLPGGEYNWVKAILALYWGAFARQNPDIFVATISPGAVTSTNLFKQGGVKPMLRGLSKMAIWANGSHSEKDGAKRYIDALLDQQEGLKSGSFWASRKGYAKDYGDVAQGSIKNAKFLGDKALEDKAWTAVNKLVSKDLN